ncbi:MAG: DNA repair protein RecN [Solirubrobacterales bacterium]|nr:MAG: DNA repair protein RecN [Solirubrobacterales bacterium]
MLHELRVENLLLMERAELRLAPGLNVLTGETGAGKTLLAHALDLLLGGRARSAAVREGAAEAYVEGVFSLPVPLQAADRERIPEGAEEVVLARRVWPDGRTRAYVCGRSATLADLRELGSRLLAFYGQHEHRKLMLATAQLDVLDAHCGEGQSALRARLGEAYQRVRGLEQRAAQLRELAGARERELDLVAFELREIEALAPTEEEEQALGIERDRLRNLEALRAAAAAGVEAISPDGGAGVAELLAGATQRMEAAAAMDPELAALSERLLALRYEAEDLGGELLRYLLSVEGASTGLAERGAPGRLEEVEERLAQLARLQRKHGGPIAEVLRHAERCRARQDELEHADEALAAAADELAQARSELDQLAAELGAARRAAAPGLAAAVRRRLAELAMPDARFEVQVRPRSDGCGPRGADAVELLIAPNPGLPAGPLREIASGGELSRVMLALLSVAHGGPAASESAPEDGQPPAQDDVSWPEADEKRSRPEADEERPLLVFDEVDAGIGGHTARAVGEHLRGLARRRQILCITHLPQVAACAARHFTIVKDVRAVPARTTVTALDGDGVVGELVRMLGAGEGDRAASQHARALLRAA